MGDKSVLQAKLTKLAIQIGYTGESTLYIYIISLYEPLVHFSNAIRTAVLCISGRYRVKAMLAIADICVGMEKSVFVTTIIYGLNCTLINLL